MTTRSQKKNTSQPSPIINKRTENSWILLTKDSLLQNKTFSMITLPHPCTGSSVKYCLDDVNNQVFEVVTFSEPNRSWFIGETVKSDGSIQMITPVNPLFLVLPKLKGECSTRAVPMEDLLSEKGYNRLMNYIGSLDDVADLKGDPDLKAYIYNEDKTLRWLQERVHKVSKVLRAKNVQVTSGAVSATFVTSNANNEDVDEEFYLRYAFDLVSEYLPTDLIEKLNQKFNFKPDLVEVIGKKRKSEASENGNNKKIKSALNISVDNLEAKMDYKPNEVKKQTSITAKDKKKLQAARGTKPITNFFK